jgi:hypothetical protein
MTTAHSEASTLVQEPAGDRLAADLLARRRKRLPALTLALVLLVAAAGAFIGGIEAQKHWGTSTSSSGTSGFPAGFASRFAGAAAGTGASGSGASSGFPSFGGFGGGASGTVTLIKGTTLYVTSASGNTVLVHTSASSRVSKTVSGSLKTIHPGDSVTIVGTQAKDGSYTARSVTIGGTTNG